MKYRRNTHRMFVLNQLAKNQEDTHGVTRAQMYAVGVANLADVIFNIRKQGWLVETQIHVDRYGRRYAKYVLATWQRPAAREWVQMEDGARVAA